jgi:2'-5' RNA ligase
MSNQFAKKLQTEYWRCFVALPLDEAHCNRLQHLQAEMRQGLPAVAQKALRLTQAHAFHLTLRFLGDVDMATIDDLQKAVHHSCRDTRPFELHLHETGCFPNSRNPRVVWAGVGGELDALRALQLRVVQQTAAFGEPPETRPYQPHLTLARINTRDRSTAHLIGQNIQRLATSTAHEPHDAGWTASEVHLIRSELLPQGSRYTTLGTFPLRPVTS